ncbi:hypothetical protein K439DRAFT_1623541 [Ramaria rubella]|nr:hypothetical protein K439DRAFT_1623541 [Ramaria rubella]
MPSSHSSFTDVSKVSKPQLHKATSKSSAGNASKATTVKSAMLPRRQDEKVASGYSQTDLQPPNPAPATGGHTALPNTWFQLSAIQEEDVEGHESSIEYVEDEQAADQMYEPRSTSLVDEALSGDSGNGTSTTTEPSPVKPSKPKAAKTNKKNTKTKEIPSLIKFGVPYQNQCGQTLTRTLHIEPTNSMDELKATIQSILGLDALPLQSCSELVVHFFKDPASCNFGLGTKEEWETIKIEWAIHAAKKGKDANIDVVLPKKFFEHLEEAVRIQNVSTAKVKAKSKAKVVNPFLPLMSDVDMPKNTEPDGHDLNPEKMVEYRRELDCLKVAWPCTDHQQAVCLVRGLNGHHKVLNFEGELAWVLALLNKSPGVDLEHPPNIEYFKFFYHKSGIPDTLTAPPLHRTGMRYHSEPPAGLQQQVMAPPININLPPEAFQFPRHLLDAHPHKHLFPSSHSSRESSPKPKVRLEPQINVAVPTIDEWLSNLETKGLTYTQWNLLREKFNAEDSLQLPISSIARLSSDNLKSGFGLKMVDLLFVMEQLEVAGKAFGFVVNAVPKKEFKEVQA